MCPCLMTVGSTRCRCCSVRWPVVLVEEPPQEIEIIVVFNWVEGLEERVGN